MKEKRSLKFGNTSFDLDVISWKSKAEFLKIYSKPIFDFDKEKAWNELKKYLPKQGE